VEALVELLHVMPDGWWFPTDLPERLGLWEPLNAIAYF